MTLYSWKPKYRTVDVREGSSWSSHWLTDSIRGTIARRCWHLDAKHGHLTLPRCCGQNLAQQQSISLRSRSRFRMFDSGDTLAEKEPRRNKCVRGADSSHERGKCKARPSVRRRWNASRSSSVPWKDASHACLRPRPPEMPDLCGSVTICSFSRLQTEQMQILNCSHAQIPEGHELSQLRTDCEPWLSQSQRPGYRERQDSMRNQIKIFNTPRRRLQPKSSSGSGFCF